MNTYEQFLPNQEKCQYCNGASHQYDPLHFESVDCICQSTEEKQIEFAKSRQHTQDLSDIFAQRRLDKMSCD